MGMNNSRNFDLLTLGQVLLRLSPPDNERLSRGDTFVKQVGGAELNVAVGAALLGLHTGVISKLPAHDIGSFMKGKIRSFGVSYDFFMYDQSSSARVGIYYYENGAYPRKPKVIYDRNNSSFFSLNIDEIPEEVYTASKCFHTTGITLALNEDIRETTIDMIKRFKAAGTLVSFDVNFRGNLWTGDEARECILRILPYVDIFFCSEDTARLTFLKTGTAREMMKSFTEEFPISIVASTQRIVHSPKRHTFGSVIYDAARNEYYEEEPYRDIEVVDRQRGCLHFRRPVRAAQQRRRLSEGHCLRQCNRSSKEYHPRRPSLLQPGRDRNHHKGPQPEGPPAGDGKIRSARLPMIS